MAKAPNPLKGNLPEQLTAPAGGGFAITPHDTNKLQEVTRCILAEADCEAVVVFERDEDAHDANSANGKTTVYLQKGYNPLMVVKVLNTGTDDDVGLVGLV